MLYSLKMILRSWGRNLLSTTISIVSLTVGLACSLTLLLYVLDEHKVSQSLGDSRQVCLVKGQNSHEAKNGKSVVRTTSTSPFDMQTYADTYPEIERLVMLSDRQYTWGTLKRGDDELPPIYGAYEGFADLFELPIEQGDLRSTLSKPGEIAITRDYANRYFTDGSDPMGQTVEAVDVRRTYDRATGQINKQEIIKSYRVTTIIDSRVRIPLRLSGLYTLSEDEKPKSGGYSGMIVSFVKLGEGVDPDEFAAKIAADTATVAKTNTANMVFVPVGEMYLTSDVQKARWEDKLIVTRSKSVFYIGITAALAILLIACFNYVNIVMTRAAGRLRNIAGQRIMGATRWSVRWQTVLDVFLSVAVSLGLALCVMAYILPPFNGFMLSDVTVAKIFEPLNLAAVFTLLFVVVSLPALFVIIKLERANPLESFRAPSVGRMNFVRTMVIAQFVVSVVLITVSITVVRQMNYIARSISGAEYVLLVSVTDNDNSLPAEFIDRLKSDASLVGWSAASTIPSMSISSPTFSASMIYTDAEFVDFYGLTTTRGRNFEAKDAEDVMIVNETFVRANKLDDPVGQVIKDVNGSDRTIVGVVADFMFAGAKQPTEPVALIKTAPNADRLKWGIYLKYRDNSEVSMERIRTMWSDMYGSSKPLPDLKGLDTIYREMNPSEARLQTMVWIFSIISMLLTALGLFGLAWYSVQRRVREIALRKIHGATSGEVVTLLCRGFLGWVAIAFVIAMPVGYFLSSEWLRDFAYRVSLPWWIGVLVALIAIAVTLLTVIFQSLSAARANPSRSIGRNS